MLINDKNACNRGWRWARLAALASVRWGGFTPRKGGERAAFCRCRGGVACAERSNPGIFASVQGPFADSTKASGLFAIFPFPRVALFFPRVALFSPRACFSAFAAFFSFFSLFHRERERKERLQAVHGNPRVEFVTRGYKTYRSWKKRAFHGFSVDGVEGDSVMNQWVTCRSPDFHGSTGVLPPLPLAVALFGGAHGGC